MKRNKLYVILSVLTFICFFSFSALCSQFITAAKEEEMSVEEEEEDSEEETEEEEVGGEEETGDEEEAEDEEGMVEGEGQAPTIRLEIYQDATYSADDDVCYYRIEAIVTGNPTPDIDWSRDDSMGSFGNTIAQVNLNRGETYTLSATATNSKGSDNDSIVLTWGCNGEEEEMAEEEEEEDAEEEDGFGIGWSHIMPYSELCGYITSDYSVYKYDDFVLVGDNSLAQQSKGFISFDIRDHPSPGTDIIEAKLKISDLYPYGNPRFADKIIISSINYGNSLNGLDFDITGLVISEYQIPQGLFSITVENEILRNDFQEAVDNDNDFYQISISLDKPTNNDSVLDLFQIPYDSIRLSISHRSE